MNKQEFIQAAALRLISARPNTPMGDIADLANALAVYIYKDEPEVPPAPVQPARTVSDPNKDDIQCLLGEIEKAESISKREFESEHPEWTYIRRGYAIILRRAFDIADIMTVGDMLKRGRIGCLKLPKVGKKCVEAVDNALKNLYNIENW